MTEFPFFLSFFLSNCPFRVYSPLAMSCLQLRETFFFYHGRKCVFDVSLLICFCGNIQSKIYVCVCVCVCSQCVSALVQPLGVCAEYLNSGLVQVSVSTTDLFSCTSVTLIPGLLDSDWSEVYLGIFFIFYLVTLVFLFFFISIC